LHLFTEEERKKREEAEHKARLDAIAEKQRQRERELEEKERLRRESLLRSSVDPVPRTVPPPAAAAETVTGAPAAAAAAAAPAPAPAPAPSSSKYVPKFRRGGSDAAPPQRAAAAPETGDRWSRPDDRPPVQSGGDRWRGSRAGGESRLPSSASSWSASRNRS
jgi:translation initiation factor 3 subunit A